MPRYDNTGVNHTCPYIDEVIQLFESLSDFDMPNGYEKDKEKAIETLEKIRSMNLELRNFGNKQSEALYEMEKDRYYYEKRCRQLENELETSNADIKHLEKEISMFELQK